MVTGSFLPGNGSSGGSRLYQNTRGKEETWALGLPRLALLSLELTLFIFCPV
jgi:hypothetical protein